MTPSETEPKTRIVLECAYCVTHPDLVFTGRRNAGSPVLWCPACGRQFALVLAQVFSADEEDGAE